jgi:hypothetical protein
MTGKPAAPPTDDFDAFLDIVRRALLMIVQWIERRQGRSPAA